MNKRQKKKRAKRFKQTCQSINNGGIMYITVDTFKPGGSITSCCILSNTEFESNLQVPKSTSNLGKICPEPLEITIRENVDAKKRLQRANELNQEMLNWYRGY